METRHELISLIIMDLNNVKIKRACREIGINPVEVCTKDHNDFLNKEFLEILLEEYEQIRNGIQQQMEYESTLPEYQWNGHYIPSDLWFDAEIEANTLIATMTDLIAML